MRFAQLPCIVSSNITDRSVVFLTSTGKYEYFMDTAEDLRRIELAGKYSEAKALNFAKRNALRWQRVEDVPCGKVS